MIKNNKKQFLLNELIINKTIIFSECKWDSIKHLFLTYHYLKSMPAGILSCYGIFNEKNLNSAVGGAVFCNGRIQYDKKYIEFSRLWINDEFGCNSESWFIAKCLKSLNKKYPNYQGVVTWADSNIGHNGTIYKACNFKYDGESRKVKKFIGKNKKIIFQRTAKNNSILISVDNPKKRFIYYFDAKKRNNF